MSVEFIPSSQEFVVSSDPEWSINGWGMDTCNILYRGPRTKSDTFLGSLVKFSSLVGYERIWLDNWEKRNITPSFPGVLLNYTGFRSGIIPIEHRLNGTSAQNIQTSVVPASGAFEGQTVTGTFYYAASRTTWTWFETAMPPIAPRYATISQGINPLLRLTGWNIPPVNNGDGDSSPVDLATIIQLFNTLTPVIIVTDYERDELVPSSFWGCRSVVEWRIQ